MVNNVDKSLLDRLQALRGGPAGSPAAQAPQEIKIDVIERAKTPSKEDALTARLRSLREGSATPEPEGLRASPKPAAQRAFAPSEKKDSVAPGASQEAESYKDNFEDVFETDDDTLQELLADVTPDEELAAAGAHEPSDEQVRALLEKLADGIPKDVEAQTRRRSSSDSELDSDDSDGEAMKRKVKDTIERYQDEAAAEAPRQGKEEDEEDEEDFQDPHDEATHDAEAADLGLPSVPSDLQHLSPQTGDRRRDKPDLDDITARLAALRAPSHNTDGGGDDEGSLSLPSVPTSRPSAKPVARLQSRTTYTDDDVHSWCTVCLDDATLRCLDCDDDAYCARCWREMHLGPAAAFDDRSHRAVQFTKDKKKKEAPRKVALGA